MSSDDVRVKIVPVSSGAEDVEPLFFFTNPPTAASLAVNLSQPVHVVLPIDVETASRVARSATEAAAVYGASLARYQESGPINVLGHCVHGVIAFETARWLRRHGRQVGFVGLLDTTHPLLPEPALPRLVEVIEPPLLAHAEVAAAARALDAAWLRRQLTPVQVVTSLRSALRLAVVRELRDLGVGMSELGQQFSERREAFLFLSLTTWLHRPALYPGDVTYIHNNIGLNSAGLGLAYLERSAHLWRETVSGTFDLLVVDGSQMEGPHDDLPGLPAVAAHITRRLA